MRLRRCVLAVGFLLLTMAGAPSAMAADPLPTLESGVTPTVEPTMEPQPELIPVHVAVWLCDDAKCPDPTQIVAGVTVAAVDTGNMLLGQCITEGDPAGCSFNVPAGSDWSFSWDDSAIPAGYVFDSIAMVSGGGWEGEAYIIQFVPAPVEPQVETVHVGVMLCETDCVAEGQLIAGVGVASVNTDTNAQVDNCETAGDEYPVCEIDVPLNEPWTFTWDSTAIPDGYHYIGHLAVVQGGLYPVVYLIRLVPDDVPTQVPTVAPAATATKAPVTTLPKTGAGEQDPANGTAGIVILAASALGLAGLAAAAVRRRQA